MSEILFPRTMVENISCSRMIIGSNWIAGYSHRSPAADNMIRVKHSEPDSIIPMLETFQNYGIDTIMALFNQHPAILNAVKMASEKIGKEFIMIDTPILPMDDNADARREAERIIKESAANGSKICMIHHSSAEQLQVPTPSRMHLAASEK